jgi:hypothetical protein
VNIDKDHKEEIQKFLENIPFEEVLARVIKINKIDHIVAVNKDLVMVIVDAFVSKGSVLGAVIPGFMYGSNVNFAAGLNQDNIRTVLEKSEILRIGNLLTNQQGIVSIQYLEVEKQNPPAEKEKKPQNIRQYLLIGIFTILLVVLAVVYLTLGSSETPPQSPKVKSSFDNAEVAPANPSVSEPSSVQIQVSIAPIDLKNVKIKIVQSLESGEISNSIEGQLLKIGFQNVVSEISQDTLSEKSSVIFSKNIPSDVRENIVTEVTKILPDISILENQESEFEVTVLIGRS